MPLTHPAIIEVGERTEQGMTKPYRCIADDGQSYFVERQVLERANGSDFWRIAA